MIRFVLHTGEPRIARGRNRGFSYVGACQVGGMFHIVASWLASWRAAAVQALALPERSVPRQRRGAEPVCESGWFVLEATSKGSIQLFELKRTSPWPM